MENLFVIFFEKILQIVLEGFIRSLLKKFDDGFFKKKH